MSRLLFVLRRIPRAVPFLVYWLGQLVRANAVVAWEVLTPRHGLAPGIAAVPLRSRTALELTLLANLLSLTPGTLTVEIDEPARILYLHGLHVADPDRFRASVRRLEDRLLKVLR